MTKSLNSKSLFSKKDFTSVRQHSYPCLKAVEFPAEVKTKVEILQIALEQKKQDIVQ